MNHRTKETIELLLKEVFIDDNSYVDEKVAHVQENSFVSNCRLLVVTSWFLVVAHVFVGEIIYSQEQSSPTELYYDNKSVIAIAQNPVQHGRTKHINVKFHSIREAEKNSFVKLHYCSTDVQLADIMTKALPKSRLDLLRLKLGMSKANLKEEC
ncbi:Copia protein [Vitis vinifera]|uniref:Copia protein n=1 Tax=Vitis vinifera TaxID=29760 RepID=A0A438I592_VITVI|nr:Copia protein [Vitis vinifera]